MLQFRRPEAAGAFVRTAAVALLVAGGLAGNWGCGAAAGTPVSGRITVTSVGPLDRGLVLFADDQVVYRGEIGSDGRYRITTGPTRDRVPAGRYRVQIVGTGVPVSETSMETEPQVAHRYESIEKTDLIVEVPDDPAGATIDFVLDPPHGGGR
jgi:hypothetical protein